jgi:PhzF family phenazine biosynthesis protein
MNAGIESQRQLAQTLAEFFYPLLEASLFDEKRALIEIFNPLSSLAEDQKLEGREERTSSEVLATGEEVKRMIHCIRGEGEVYGYLRLRYDVSKLRRLHGQLEILLQMPGQKEVNDWQSSIDRLITQYLTKQQITLEGASSRQKRELIAHLYGKKLFDFKDASTYIAAKLQMSRASIYNYLKTISALQQVEIHQVDAFTDQKFGGNPAGVVLDADALDDVTMKKITKELNLSETAFVLSSSKGDFQLRYFTPTGHEIDFCGHSTVGTLYTMAREKRQGMQGAGHYTFSVETRSGLLKMEISIDSNESIEVSYEPPRPKLAKSKIDIGRIAHAAGLPLDSFEKELPLMCDQTMKVLFIPVKSLHSLRQMQPDYKAMNLLSKEHDLMVLCFLTKETFDPKSQIHMRCFAPAVGINEDPFTGCVLGGLTTYVDQFHLLPPKATRFRAEQGHIMERPGFVEVDFSKNIKVTAKAIHCFSTEINLT